MSSAPSAPSTPRWSPHAVSVVATRNSEGRSAHTLYVLIVQYDASHQWTIERRFSEFEDLRSALSEFMSGPSLPLLPAKTFTRSLDAGFVAWRRKELDRWMQHLMQSEFVVRSAIFAHFCGVLQQMGEKAVSSALPTELKSITDPQFGINDCHYCSLSAQEQLIFTACEDVNPLSKLERKLTNIRLPWESQGGVAPLGCCAGWKLSETGDWKPNYECAASAVCFVPSPPSVYVGLDTGHVWSYSVSGAYSDYTPICDLEAHSARVMKLAYSSQQQLVVSISRDKHLVVIDHSAKRVRYTVPVGHPGIAVAQGGLAAMELEDAQQRLFIGTFAHSIYIYHLPAGSPPQLLHVLQGHSGTVRALYLDSVNHYLFSGSYDYRVGVWSVHDGVTASEVGRSRLNGMMSQGPSKQITSVVYCNALREVVTGVEGGWLCVWNTFTGRLAYVWKGHTHTVSQLIFVNATRTLISVSLDGKVKFWSFPVRQRVDGGAEKGRTAADDNNQTNRYNQHEEQRTTDRREAEGKDEATAAPPSFSFPSSPPSASSTGSQSPLPASESSFAASPQAEPSPVESAAAGSDSSSSSSGVVVSEFVPSFSTASTESDASSTAAGAQAELFPESLLPVRSSIADATQHVDMEPDIF